jgi:hypothetical protein
MTVVVGLMGADEHRCFAVNPDGIIQYARCEGTILSLYLIVSASLGCSFLHRGLSPRPSTALYRSSRSG